MRYRGLYNNTVIDRAVITQPYVWWDDAFTSEELDRVVSVCQSGEMKRGVTFGGNEKGIRLSSVSMHNWSEEKDWIFQRLNQTIERINDRWYGFDLNGYDYFQYTEYDGKEQGKYDWHMDTCLGSQHLPSNMVEPRKLSLTLLLSQPGTDYEGGDFEINMGDQARATKAELTKRGRIIAFPSWLCHRVLPVTKGVRRSVVVWVVGPKFV